MSVVEIQNLHCGCGHRVHQHRGLSFTSSVGDTLQSGPCAVQGCGCRNLFSQPYPPNETISWSQDNSPFNEQVLRRRFSVMMEDSTS